MASPGLLHAVNPSVAVSLRSDSIAVQGDGAGRRLTAYPALKPEVVGAGGIWCEVNETFSNAVGHLEWIRKFPKVLGMKIEP
jgi:protease I